jgi:methionine--tRNA ligase beta chain
VEDVVTDITPLEIRVGKIVEISKHPEADKLYIEKIDCGEESGPRTIVSGLVPYCSEADLLHRKVIVLCNLKPRPLVGVLSHGMVLCASDTAHTRVDPLTPPEQAKIGELVHFKGHVCDPKPPGNAAVKAFKRVADKLFSNDEGVATYDGSPFMTETGPCTSHITNGKVS